jgi:PKD repeat protein
MEVLQIYNPLVIVNLVTDTKGSDIIWELRDANTDTLIFSKGPFNDVIPYNANLATHIDSILVDFNQQVKFKITDIAGNGLYDGQIRGSIKISNECVPVIHSNNTFLNADSVEFNANIRPDFNIGPDRSVCEFETIVLDAGASAYEYIWNINGTVLTGNPIVVDPNLLNIGFNNINVRNSALTCFNMDTILITKNASPLSSFQTTQLGGFITCTADETNASTYTWNFGDGTTATGRNVTHQYISNGIYNVSLVVSSAAACTNGSNKNLTITGVGIQNNFESIINLFPNPSTGIIYVDAANVGNVSIEVIDLQGRKLYDVSNLDLSQKAEINLSNLEKGNYFVRIISKSGTITKKFTIY